MILLALKKRYSFSDRTLSEKSCFLVEFSAIPGGLSGYNERDVQILPEWRIYYHECSSIA